MPHFPHFLRRTASARSRSTFSLIVAASIVMLLSISCSDSSASRERRRLANDRAERDRPLTVASRGDSSRSNSAKDRPYSARTTSSGRAHFDPKPAGYDDNPRSTRRRTRDPLRRVEPERRPRTRTMPRPVEPTTQAPPPAPPSDTYVAPPPVEAAPENSMRVYHVQRGDTLWSLAKRYYGDSKHWRRILAANRNRVPDPRNLPVGIKLIIP